MNKYILQKKFKNILLSNNIINDNDIAIILCNYTNYNINPIKLNSNIKWFYMTNCTDINVDINNIEIINDDYHTQYVNFNNNANKNKELLIEKFYKTQLLNLDKFKNYKYIYEYT